MTNIVLIVGNLGADPVTRSTSGGDITTISVATTRRWNTKDGDKREETEWHRVTCFNGLGKNVAKYTRKGLEGLGPGPPALQQVAGPGRHRQVRRRDLRRRGRVPRSQVGRR